MIEINRNPTPRQLRQFAVLCVVFCGVAGLLLHRAGHEGAALAVWLGGGALGLAGLAAPATIRPVFIGMSLAAYPIGWVISHVLIVAIWVLVITPIALLLRARGKDLLEQRFDAGRPSYWTPREADRPPERYLRQF
jgi:hypothetical protein